MQQRLYFALCSFFALIYLPATLALLGPVHRPRTTPQLSLTRRTAAPRCVQLLHFHCGSQITNIRMVKEVMREATFLYAELVKVGANVVAARHTAMARTGLLVPALHGANAAAALGLLPC